jgi:hypothetical protein
MSQTRKAAPKSASMLMEMSLVDRVFIVLMSCGNNEIVVSVAPNNPRAIIKSILLSRLARSHIYSFPFIYELKFIKSQISNQKAETGYFSILKNLTSIGL